ncbi:MAG: DUF433 domain-containing protein [Desulfovibrionales bacterium]|nr:DUF433 domain-containing protein [Desulfovibrionales bacterium]
MAFFRPLIEPAAPPRLSFWNLVEAHVLRALRTEHVVSVRAVRNALDYAQGKFGITHLLLSPELRTSAGELFLEKYGELINLTKAGQVAIKEVLMRHLQRVEWDPQKMPIRLFPFSHTDISKQLIVIDPLIAFGRPIIKKKGISTAAIVARIDAGESPDEVAKDYDLELSDVTEVLLYEKAA